MYCFKCGTKLINGSLFCYNCGQDLAAILEIQASASAAEPSDNKEVSTYTANDSPAPASYDPGLSFFTEPVSEPEPVVSDDSLTDDIWEEIPEVVYLTLSRYSSDFLDGADVNISIDGIGYGKIDAGRGKRYQISSGLHKIEFELGGEVTSVELDLKKDTYYDFIVNSFGSVEEFTEDD